MDYIPVSITIPPSILQNEGDVPIVQTAYSTPILFPLLRTGNDSNMTVDSEVIGVSLINMTVMNTTEPINIVLQSTRLREGMVRNFN